MNPNINTLLIEYKKLIDQDLLRVFIVKREGTIIEDLKAGEVDNNINIFNEILSKIIERFPIGSFGGGIYENEQYVFLIFEANSEIFFVTVLSKTANIDLIFIYSCLTAEKISMIFKEKPTSLIMPKFLSQNIIKTQYIERKIGVIQKIKVKIVEIAYKFILGGEEGINKISLISQFAENAFQTDYKSTIGTSILKIEISFKNLNIKVRLVVWNLAPQAQFKRVRQSYFANAEAVILVFNIANHESFEIIEKWHKEFISVSPEISLILIGNKSDSKRQVSSLEGEKLARKLGCISYIESSPKNRETIYDGLKLLALNLILKDLVTIDITDEIILEKEELPPLYYKIYYKIKSISDRINEYEFDVPVEIMYEFLLDFSNIFETPTGERIPKIDVNENKYYLQDVSGPLCLEFIEKILNKKLVYQYDFFNSPNSGEKGKLTIEFIEPSPGSVKLRVKNEIQDLKQDYKIDGVIPNLFGRLGLMINWILPKILAKQIQAIFYEKTFDDLNKGNYRILQAKLNAMGKDIDKLRAKYFEVKAPITLNSFNCSECGATLKIISKEEKFIICEHCDTPFLMEWQKE